MDAKTFLIEFGHIASAPDGIQQLRGMILQLAVSGRLAFRDHADGSVDDDLSETAQDRSRYAQQLKLRAVGPDAPLSADTYPYPIPDHWRWMRLEQATLYIQRGKSPSYAAAGKTRVVSQKCVQWSGFRLEPSKYVTDESLSGYGEERFLKDGDVLLNSTGTGTVGRAAVYEGAGEVNAVADSHVTVLRLSNFLPRYVWCVLAAPWMQARMAPEHESSVVSGTTNQVELATGSVRRIAFPCPPVCEQRRIVAKVKELTALCDKLEAQQRRRNELRASTQFASCRELANVRSAAALAPAWQRVRDNVGLWLGGQDSVDDLAQSIGYLGCRGLLAGAKFPASDGDEGERPALPPGWTWEVLGDLAEYITSGSRGWRAYLAPSGDVFIRSQDIKHDELRFEDRAFVALPEKAEGKRTLVRAGDLLMTITGANVGKCAQMPPIAAKAYVSQHVALIRIKDVRNTPFLHFWLTNAYGGRQHLARFIYGDKPGLNLPQVASIPVPLPPQDVQDRIVESLGHYRALCDRLAQQLDDARRLSQALAQASVAAVTGFGNEEQATMKTPKTELISTLQLGATKPDRQEAAPLAGLLVRQPGAMSAKALWGASGLDIDAFYQQLKTEMANGWIVQPEVATMREVATS